MAAALGSRAGRALHAAVAVTLSPRHVAPTTLSRSVLGQPPAAAWSRCALAPMAKRGYSTFMGVSAKRASDGAPLNVDAMLLNPARFNLVTREWLNLDLPHVAQSVDSVLAAAVPAAPAAGAGAASAGAASAGAPTAGAPTAGAPTAGAASAGAGARSSTSTDAAASPPASAPAASSAAAEVVDKAGGEGSTDPKTEEPMTLRDVVSNYPNRKLWSYLAGTHGLAMHTFLGDLHAQHPQALIRSYYCFDSEMYAIEVRPPLHDDDDGEDNSSLHSFFEKMAVERATYCRGKVSSTSRSTEECGCAGIQQVLKLDNLCTSAPATPTATIASMLKLNEGKRPSKKRRAQEDTLDDRSNARPSATYIHCLAELLPKVLPTLGDSYTSDQLAAGLATALIAVGSWRNTHASQNWLTELYVPAALGGGAVDMVTALRYGLPNGRAAWARALNEYAWADMPEFERALEAAAENRSLYKWRVKRIACPWSSKYNGFAESPKAHMPVMNNLMAMAMGLRY